MNQPEPNHKIPGDLVVVIGREFGSGGRTVGRKVADNLGIAYYDKELLNKAAHNHGLDPTLFEEADEKRPSPFRALVQGMFGVPDNFHTTSMSREQLYACQSEAIKKICAEGPCVIVGRTADYVMRECPSLVSVFLHAPVEKRARMILDRGESQSIAEASEKARRRDRERESYYNYFTGRVWGKASNYHLTIDTSKLSENEITEIILAYVKGINKD